MKKCYILFVATFIAALLSCQSRNQVQTSDLVIVEQTDTIYGSEDFNNYYKMSLTVDVPANGPQTLVDSVMAFANRQLYDACESNVHLDEKIVSSKWKMFILMTASDYSVIM